MFLKDSFANPYSSVILFYYFTSFLSKGCERLLRYLIVFNLSMINLFSLSPRIIFFRMHFCPLLVVLLYNNGRKLNEKIHAGQTTF